MDHSPQNLTLSLTPAEGFLMTSEWVKVDRWAASRRLASSGASKAGRPFGVSSHCYLLMVSLPGGKQIPEKKAPDGTVTDSFP